MWNLTEIGTEIDATWLRLMNLKSRQEMPLKQFIDLTTTMILLFGPLASMYIALSILWIALGLGIIELNEPITPKVFLYAIPIIIVIQIVFSAWCCSIVGGKKWLKDKLELKKKRSRLLP